MKMPSYGSLPWEVVIAAVEEAVGAPPEIDRSSDIGHQMVIINFNSLSRIIDKFRNE